jgi:periplasmic protein TonB
MVMFKSPTTLDLEGTDLDQRENIQNGTSAPWNSNISRRPIPVHFEEGLVDHFHLKKPRSILDIFVSVLAHSAAVALVILLPLYYTHAIDLSQLQKTLLVAPPPPPPPPPAAAQVIHAHPKSFFHENKLLSPRFIPKRIVQVKEEAAKPGQTFGGVTGGVPGGIPGGQIGGVLGGILGSMGKISPPPPPPKIAAHVGPYLVGGRVQEPRLVQMVQPIYPPLAKQAHIQGDVRIDSVIDERGNVTQMKVVSGRPLLVTAALDAVQQWKYEPTLLNGTPIPVEMIVTVRFTLGS